MREIGDRKQKIHMEMGMRIHFAITLLRAKNSDIYFTKTGKI